MSARYPILFHRTTPWSGAVRCSTNQFARQFIAAGHPVSYMQGAVHLAHFIRGNQNLSSYMAGPRLEDEALVFTPLTLVPFMRNRLFNNRLAADQSTKHLLPSLPSVFSDYQRSFPQVIWTTQTGSSGLKRQFPGAKLFFQVIDYYPAFLGERIKRIERLDYEQADHIFSIGQALTHYLTGELGVPPEKITTLGQGVNLDAYQTDHPEPADLADLPHPRAIWVGVLDKLDEPLLEETLSFISARGGSVILIGHQTETMDQMARKHAALHLLGPKPSESVPAYLTHADIGLMLYNQQRAEIYRGQHPLKLYEYAAAGLPIVSTPHTEFETLNPPVVTVQGKDELPHTLEFILSHRDQLSSQLIQFAQAHTWKNKFKLAKAIIDQHLALR